MKIYLLLLCLVPFTLYSKCLENMVEFKTYCIDKYEAPNILGQRPFVAKTAVEGEVWCGANGKRLCTEDEWLSACEGAVKRKHPYGENWTRNTCNDEKVWRPVNWGKVNRYPAPDAIKEINKLNQSEPSGKFSNCVTPEGVFDMGGNSSEWVTKTRYHTSPWKHVMMGCYWSGCYASHRGKDRSICRGTNAGHPGDARFRSYEAGFRCCSDNL